MKQKVSKVVKTETPKVTLVTYTMHATIPTMMYGNIQPEITVQASSIEDASSVVMKHIVDLYNKYCEDPRDGKLPKIMVTSVGSNLTVTSAPVSKKQDVPYVSEAVTKATNAINNASGPEALNLISGQIIKSTKLNHDEKDKLTVMLLKRIGEFNQQK